jgi:hypothetical protein
MGLALRRARCPISATKRISLLSHVGDWAESGRVVLKMSFVVRDPKPTQGLFLLERFFALT